MFSKLEMTSVSIYRVQVKRSSKIPNFSVLCERAKCLHIVIVPAEKHVCSILLNIIPVCSSESGGIWSILLNIIPVCNSESGGIFGHVPRMPVKSSGDKKVGFRFTFEYLRRVSPAVPMKPPVHPLSHPLDP